MARRYFQFLYKYVSNSNPVNLPQDRSENRMPRQAYTLPENLFLDFMEYLGGQVAREGFLIGQF